MAGGTHVAPARPSLRQALPWAGLVIAGVAVLPPYTRDLNTEMRVEVADHVVPGLVMLGVSLTMLVRSRRATTESEPGMLPLAAGFTILLAGLWMTATHLPLVNQARRSQNDVSWFDATWHTVPGLIVLALGLVWAAAWWSAGAGEPSSSAPGTPE
jgi:hypothetical protein